MDCVCEWLLSMMRMTRKPHSLHDSAYSPLGEYAVGSMNCLLLLSSVERTQKEHLERCRSLPTMKMQHQNPSARYPRSTKHDHCHRLLLERTMKMLAANPSARVHHSLLLTMMVDGGHLEAESHQRTQHPMDLVMMLSLCAYRHTTWFVLSRLMVRSWH